MMTDQINLTSEQAREFHETGRVELWTEIDPQPEECPDCKGVGFWDVMYGGDLDQESCRKCGGDEKRPGEGFLFDGIDEQPLGPDGERWIAEPYLKGESPWIETIRHVSYQYCADGKTIFVPWRPAETMPREASRANANITTTVEQRDGVWGFVTIIEAIK